jgi:hypothetical protein
MKSSSIKGLKDRVKLLFRELTSLHLMPNFTID